MNAVKVPNVAVTMIVISGALLILTTIILAVLVYKANQEIVENRRIGCISRSLDHQEYAPQCKQYLPKGPTE